MSEAIIKEAKETYQKQNSFETFHTNLAYDIEEQRQRILKCLKGYQDTDAYRQEVIQAAEKELQKNEGGTFAVSQYMADELAKIEDADVPRYIFHRYRYDIHPNLRKLDDYPPYLQIEPTSICNYRCVFCYQSDESFSTKKSGHMGSMTFEMYKDIVDQVEGKVDFISLASRGEPLICRDIDQMLEYSVGKFLGLKINTNASMMTEKHAHAILAGGINTVVFSADAAVEPLYSKLRVGGSLEKVVKNIKLFNDIRRKHYPQSKIISRVSGVKVNEEQEMTSMKGTWGELVDQLSFVTYNPWENVYDASVKNIQTPCSDLWRRMFVWYDGRVNPCDTDYKSTLSVGKFPDMNISDLWLSNPYGTLRTKHIENQRQQAEPCRRCTVI